MTKTEVVLCAPVRTAIGAYNGTLKSIPATELGAVVVRETVARAGIDPALAETAVLGNVIQAANHPRLWIDTGPVFLFLPVRFMGICFGIGVCVSSLLESLTHKTRRYGMKVTLFDSISTTIRRNTVQRQDRPGRMTTSGSSRRCKGIADYIRSTPQASEIAKAIASVFESTYGMRQPPSYATSKARTGSRPH